MELCVWRIEVSGNRSEGDGVAEGVSVEWLLNLMLLYYMGLPDMRCVYRAGSSPYFASFVTTVVFVVISNPTP